MAIFSEMIDLGHEQVIFCRNERVGLRAIIAIHDTTLGPALGGCRLYPYKSEEDAITDALRLSRGMTYKAAVAGLDLGGGKAVIIGDPSIKSEGLWRAFGRHVESLNGRYITAEDMNTNVDDMNYIRRETAHVTGTGGHVGGSGDPGPVTAWGVYHGIRATLDIVYGSPDVRGRTVAVQGLGSVGARLLKYLHKDGAKVIVTDLNSARVRAAREEWGAEVVEGDDFFRCQADVLAPCAVGGIIDERTIPMIRAPIVAGGANNILRHEAEDAEALKDRGIIYAPDYVINAGGLMSVYAELQGWPHDHAMQNASNIFHTVKRVVQKAQADGTTTIVASNRIAEDRIGSVANIHTLRV